MSFVSTNKFYLDATLKDIMEHLDIISLIGNTGFPIAITAYLLIRLEKQLTSLSNSINTLNTIVSVKLGAVVKDEKDKAA